MCRLIGATCPRSTLRNPGYAPNRAGYLRVVLGEEVGPVCRRGDAYDKYSLKCEEAENTVRLGADRHFPLNIQETGINKRRTGRTVVLAAELRITELQRKSMWWEVMVGGGFWTLQQAVKSQSETHREDWQQRTREIRMRKMLCRRCC